MPSRTVNFPARKYLSEYYRCLDYENYALMSFLHRAYSFIGRKQRLIDIGSGPTIYQFISASRAINQIISSDPLLLNRQEIVSWLTEDSHAYNWDAFIDYASELESMEGSIRDSQHIKARMRKHITSVVPYDIHTELIPSAEEFFDVASAHFCLECAADTLDDFSYCLRNILRILKPDGFFVTSLLKKAHSYSVGDLWLPALPVKEELIEQLFVASGLVLIQLETVKVDAHRGYEGIIFCLSKKKESCSRI